MAIVINYKNLKQCPAQFVTNLAEKIYKAQGYTLNFNTWQETANYFLNSQHSREKQAMFLAEDFYLLLVGDTVDWSDLENKM